MANFESALKYCLQNEGGFSNIPEDSGGATNLGITHDEWARWVGHPVSVDDMRHLTLESVTPIYEKEYWKMVSCDQIHEDAVATCLFDMAVNFGPSAASKLAQNSCNLLGAHLSVDGQIGPLSLAAINSQDPKLFVQTFEGLVNSRYLNIVANNPTQRIFLNGWLNRARRLLTLIA